MPRRIAITGASRGIGLGLARAYAERGDTVYASCRDPQGAAELNRLGVAAVLPCDIADPGSIAAFGEAIAEHTDALDQLVNNAGITSLDVGATRETRSPFTIDPAHLQDIIRINAIGPMLVTRAVLGLLEAGEQPLVLNMSSQLGSMVVAARMPGDIGYIASKAAMNAITVSSAALMAERGVRFICMHPGWVRTDMSGPSAALSVEESVAGIVATLDGLGAEQTGLFLRHDGSVHPW
jgi:NAD(P)-dependent dehydrogenase (short-subunit alcohol dehydrogenase family)